MYTSSYTSMLLNSTCESELFEAYLVLILSMLLPGLEAVWNTTKVEKGANVVIFGLGIVGLVVGSQLFFSCHSVGL